MVVKVIKERKRKSIQSAKTNRIVQDNMAKYIFDSNSHLIYKNKKQPFDFLFHPRFNVIADKFAKGTKIHNVLWSATHWLSEYTGYLYRSFKMKKWEVVPNRIVFFTFQNTFTCNCKYIAEKLLEQNENFELIFIVSNDVYENRSNYEIPSQIFLAKRYSPESYYALATSAYWFDNALNCIWNPIPKKEEQTYINTWHGSLGIKRLNGKRYWRHVAKTGNKQIDYFLTDSVFEEKVFSKSFWPDVKHLKVGHPRNDIFFSQEKLALLKKKVYNYYQIPENVQLVLYAPTFRDNKKDTSAIHIDYENLVHSLSKRFGGEWRVLNRFHYHNVNENTSELRNTSEYIIDACDYPDIQELLAAAAVGITDYSSWIFDFIFTGRPAFVYATDIKNYVNDRGFYYPLTKTPFSIADSDKQLSENIESFDSKDYQAKLQHFLKGKGCYEKGSACEQLIAFIKSNTQKK